jgi:hypothetical protein
LVEESEDHYQVVQLDLYAVMVDDLVDYDLEVSRASHQAEVQGGPAQLEV